MTPSAFFDTYGQYAVNTQVRHGIPASIVLAQAALESRFGSSGLTVSANNFFGIKDHDKDEWYGEFVAKDTTEYTTGAPSTVTAKFRKYTNPQQSFNDHANFLKRNKRYKPLFSYPADDYTNWAMGLQRVGYATDPNYASKLINTIKQYGLAVFDQQAVKKKSCSSPPPPSPR